MFRATAAVICGTGYRNKRRHPPATVVFLATAQVQHGTPPPQSQPQIGFCIFLILFNILKQTNPLSLRSTMAGVQQPHPLPASYPRPTVAKISADLAGQT
jgi:hypothetical protein